MSGGILERGFDGSLKSSKHQLAIEGSKKSCEHTGRVKFKFVLLEVCMT